MKRTTPLFIFLALLSAKTFAAEELRLESGVQQTVMIELYTSQGCNSCPPAEEYLNGYVDHPGLWKTFIPMAFHVDYWDYLGWKDRFAHPRNSARQRDYANLRHVRTVYTPAFIVNGRGWRPGLLDGEPRVDTPPVGRLAVTLNGDKVRAILEPAGAVHQRLVLNVAVLGMGLTTQIQAGENEGRRSPHEFVVLAHKQLAGEAGRWETTLPAFDTKNTPRLALAAWVSRPDDPTPLQAVGGYIQ